MGLEAVLRRYVIVFFFNRRRMVVIPDYLYTKMQLTSLGRPKMYRSDILYILSNDCKAELQAIRRTGTTYNRRDCIKDLHRVMNNLVLTLIFRFVMALIRLNGGVYFTFNFCYMAGEGEASVYICNC